MYFNISKKHKRTLYFVIMYEYAIIGLKSPRFSVTQKPGIDIYIYLFVYFLCAALQHLRVKTQSCKKVKPSRQMLKLWNTKKHYYERKLQTWKRSESTGEFAFTVGIRI